MTAYKATNNLKCLNQSYEVGKTYQSSKMKICKHGFHYCQKMKDTLNYYKPTKDFVLLEIEILGNVETEDDKSVTDMMKVIRIIPREEYTEEMIKRFPVYEYDSRGNKISETYPDGYKITYEYDSRGNKISETYPDGYKYTYEYDEPAVITIS